MDKEEAKKFSDEKCPYCSGSGWYERQWFDEDRWKADSFPCLCATANKDKYGHTICGVFDKIWKEIKARLPHPHEKEYTEEYNEAFRWFRRGFDQGTLAATRTGLRENKTDREVALGEQWGKAAILLSDWPVSHPLKYKARKLYVEWVEYTEYGTIYSTQDEIKRLRELAETQSANIEKMNAEIKKLNQENLDLRIEKWNGGSGKSIDDTTHDETHALLS